MKAIFLLLPVMTAFAQTAVIPISNATVRGDSVSNYTLATYPATNQNLYSEAILKAAGIQVGDVITGIRYRLALNQTPGPMVPSNFANWDLTLSKSTRAVGSLTEFIPGNMASDAVKVRSGPLTVPANAMPSGKLVNDFGFLIPFLKNYTYTGGDLLITMTHEFGDWEGTHALDAIRDPANVQSVAVLRYNTANANQNDPIVPIIQLTFTRSTTVPLFTAAGVLNAASYAGGGVAAGEIITLYGERLGQAAVVTSSVANGRFGTVAGATRILFDGIAAPMIYSSRGQAAAIVPYAVAGKASTQVVVEVNGEKSAPIAVAVLTAAPGIFTVDSSGKGQAALLNQDTSLNGAANPAAPGSIVVIYLTGEGQTNPPGADGALALGPAYAKPILPVTVTIGGFDAEVLYAGAAPGLVTGLMQINARIHPLTPPADNSALVVKIGDKPSQIGITLAVR